MPKIGGADSLINTKVHCVTLNPIVLMLIHPD